MFSGKARSLKRRLRKLCYRSWPCLALAFNLGPLFLGFFGGLVGALIPLFVAEALSPEGGRYAITVLANMAAGVTAGIAAAAAKRPARIVIRGFDVYRVNPGVARVEVLAVNESSVTARDASLYVTGFETQGFRWLLTLIPEHGKPTLYLVGLDGETCCMCPGCMVWGVSPHLYMSKAGARSPRFGLRVRGVSASTMPPRSLLEAPLVELEVVDARGCEWRDCSSLRRCGALRIETLVVARVMSGGQVLAVMAAPLEGGAWEGMVEARLEVSGDPVPYDDYFATVAASVSLAEEGAVARILVGGEDGFSLERWVQLPILRCSREDSR